MITRRGLFGLLRGAPLPAPEPESLEVRSNRDGKPTVRVIPVHRPPGAVVESDFLQHCTRCGDCLRACPHEAISLASSRYRTAAGTPIVVPDSAPCQLCPDKPCISACSTGVLRLDNPQKMATARVETLDCLAWQRSFCSLCEERCPVPGAVVSSEGKPQIQESDCLGCGICLSVCPAPRKAILLTPEMNRPAWRGQADG